MTFFFQQWNKTGKKRQTSSKTFCSCAAKYKNTENKKGTLNERKSRASYLKPVPEVPRTRRLSVFCLVTNSGGREKTVLASRSGKPFAITAPQDVSCDFSSRQSGYLYGDGMSVGVRQSETDNRLAVLM